MLVWLNDPVGIFDEAASLQLYTSGSSIFRPFSLPREKRKI
jgi:hypothetical protein